MIVRSEGAGPCRAPSRNPAIMIQRLRQPDLDDSLATGGVIVNLKPNGILVPAFDI